MYPSVKFFFHKTQNHGVNFFYLQIGIQHDAEEFLSKILMICHEELENILKLNQTYGMKMFQLSSYSNESSFFQTFHRSLISFFCTIVIRTSHLGIYLIIIEKLHQPKVFLVFSGPLHISVLHSYLVH